MFPVHTYIALPTSWDANVYPHTRFSSEFGFQSMCSMRSLKAVTKKGDLDQGILSKFLNDRQHHPGGNPEMQRQFEPNLLPPGKYTFNTEESLTKFVAFTQVMSTVWRNTGFAPPSTIRGSPCTSLLLQIERLVVADVPGDGSQDRGRVSSTLARNDGQQHRPRHDHGITLLATQRHLASTYVGQYWYVQTLQLDNTD